MPMSHEQRRAAGERLAKARAAKLAKQEAAATATPEPAIIPEPDPQPTISQSEYADLLRQIEELKALPRVTPGETQSVPSVNDRGRLIGTYEKYVVNPAYYPDPSARLAAEPRLARFAFDINYELKFEVSVDSYQSQDGVNTREPRFTLELIKVVMDEETGDPTNQRYVIRTMMAHEDPQAALTVAKQQGIDVDSFGGEAEFLNEMRYIRFRDWLLEAFFPPKNTGKKSKRETVIGNRVVQLYEISSVDAQSMPFGELKGKIG